MAVIEIQKYKTLRDEFGNKIQVPKTKEEWNKDTYSGKKTWYFYDRYTLNGERKQYKSLPFATKSEAKEHNRIFLNDPINYILTYGKRSKNNLLLVKDKVLKNSKILNDLFSEFLNYLSGYVKESTIYEYKGCWENHLSDLLGNIEYINVDLSKIKNVKEKLDNKINSRTKKQYNIETKNKWIYCLSAFFDYLFKEGLIEANYIKIVGGFRNPNININEEKKIKFQKEEDFNKFMSVVDDDFWYSFFNFLFWHGVRIGEQRAIRIKNVNLDKRYIIIEDNVAKDKNGREIITSIKNRKKRKIYIAEQSVPFIKKLIDTYKRMDGYNDSWFLFGGPIMLSKNIIQRKLHYYYMLLKQKFPNDIINELTHHEFGRHSHASLLLNKGLSKGLGLDEICTMIAQRLGDTPDVIRSTYAHNYVDDNEKKIQNLLN